MKSQKIQWMVLGSIALGLTGCGGGSGGSDATQSSSLSSTSGYKVSFQLNSGESIGYNDSNYDFLLSKSQISSLLNTGESVNYNDSAAKATISGATFDPANSSLYIRLAGQDANGATHYELYPVDRFTRLAGVGDDLTSAKATSTDSANHERKIMGNIFRYNEGAPADYMSKALGYTNLGSLSETGLGVTIASIEEGYDTSNPGLSGKISSANWIDTDNFTYLSSNITSQIYSNTADADEAIAHGSAVASTLMGDWSLKSYMGHQYSFGYGSARGANYLALEENCNQVNDTTHITVPSTVNELVYNLNNNPTAQSMLSGLAALNYSRYFGLSMTVLDDMYANEKQLMTSWRSGKGMSIVVASGNFFKQTSNISKKLLCTNYRSLSWGSDSIPCDSVADNLEANTPYTLAIGATNIENKKTEYSASGAGLWVTAPGDQWLATYGDDGAKFWQGTSFAAPFVTGVIADMLEANPNLTWRDVRYILAKTATQLDPNLQPDVEQTPAGKMTLRYGWQTNADGFRYSSYYGFGGVDAKAAVAMAKNYTGFLGNYAETAYKTASEFPLGNQSSYTASDLKYGYVDPLPAGSQAATPTDATFNFSSSDGVNSVENIVIKFNGRTNDGTGLFGVLESPSGTKRVVISPLQATSFTSSTNPFIVVNSFYGESAIGTWTLHFYDLTGTEYTSPFGTDSDVDISSVSMKINGADVAFN